ncbi:MarR family winged helix-turn-helix transcriptional regulator [Nonomuraea soli]|uniref:DNA-binding MarR family transcriptional regulator n=1 Tax=Nonomuraea soli TaxID=1032476 RepID=A0A7W0CJ10_9ACTN|nr:MarR family winged helix-turn-helix transcriptional regulator [Nonomuraea soli]MBA2891974.1 DNA-binding MarR family transcriptional regulator [Nonomuraea soli]
MAEPRWLDDREFRAWLGYRRMRLLLDAQIARDMQRDSGLSDADYDVLSALSSRESRRWRLQELADRMTWSKSRLSRHIGRMEERGLVTREGCDTDARGSVIVLSEGGWRAIQEAAPLHVASVRTHLIDLLTPEQIESLGDIAETVLGRLSASRD